MKREQIRNVAIIAHVDHGKTTLVDQLLRQSGQFRDNELKGDCIMDSNPLEKERGITILSKNCAIGYTDRQGQHYHINIVDTPGHADFSGEVERVLKMADGALLLVDAVDGTMPQTRYVLGKALANGLKPIVVINKMDRPEARPASVLNEVFDLLVDLGADDHALDFPVVYASGREGWASLQADGRPGFIHDLFDAIIKYVPAPEFDAHAPLQVLITNIDYNDYVGRIGIGRVMAGTLKVGMNILNIDIHGKRQAQKVAQLMRFEGLGRIEVDHIDVGDICAVIGLEKVDIGDTLADPEHPRALPPLHVDEPTIHMTFRINDGPFSGQEGTYVTSRQVRERLDKELQSNVALRVVQGELREEFEVSGRGLLHLGILLENMRREGYELCVGKPKAIFREENGQRLEPIERLTVDVPSNDVGVVMQLLGDRRSEMIKMDVRGPRTYLEFLVPARGLIGLRNRMLNATSGEAIMHHTFEKYDTYRGDMPTRPLGVLIATESGGVTAYALDALTNRGTMFVSPGDKVYMGQIVGENCKDDDICVNVAKLKKLSNMRQSMKEQTVTLKAPRDMSLEVALEYIEDDELVELTPQSIRLRKRFLNENDRKRYTRR
jgi:GTP-binding protein